MAEKIMVSKVPINRSVVIKSVVSAVSKVCEHILDELRARDFSQDDIFAVYLSLEEAFNNAIKHGNKMDSDKDVKIKYSLDSDKTQIVVTDQGEGFDPKSVPDPRYGDNLYQPGGRGLFLIRSYMDVVEYNEHGNCVQMVRNRSKEAEVQKVTQKVKH